MLRRFLDSTRGRRFWHHYGTSEVWATAQNAGSIDAGSAKEARGGRDKFSRSAACRIAVFVSRGAAGTLLAACAAGGGVVSLCEPRDEGAPHRATTFSLFSDFCALWQRRWAKDWDGRAPPAAKDGQEKVKTQGRVRHLLLVRHGQYVLDDNQHGLTDLGREQARLLGERLAKTAAGIQRDKYGELRVKYAGIWSSDVKRAVETADIISGCLPGVPRLPADPLLAEGPPTEDGTTGLPRGTPKPFDDESHSSRSRESQGKRADLWKDSIRIEAAFRRYVHRDVDHKQVAGEQAEATNTKEDSREAEQHTWEIIVCHANVIRYLVMRALQLPPEAWLRLRGDNCSLTELIIRPNGSVSLYRFADTGHLPIEMHTFH